MSGGVAATTLVPATWNATQDPAQGYTRHSQCVLCPLKLMCQSPDAHATEGDCWRKAWKQAGQAHRGHGVVLGQHDWVLLRRSQDTATQRGPCGTGSL